MQTVCISEAFTRSRQRFKTFVIRGPIVQLLSGGFPGINLQAYAGKGGKSRSLSWCRTPHSGRYVVSTARPSARHGFAARFFAADVFLSSGGTKARTL
jgi:hypothetical protein